MSARVRELISAYRGEKIITALSGGADSVCLLYMLHEIRSEDEHIGRRTFRLEACHINHKLRGEASDNDEKFVRELCEKLKIPLHVREIDVKALQKKHQGLEEAAREARYSYFSEIGTGAFIATAHTASDNAETVLLNLIRGTGLKGLCGIPQKRDNIIRPLIEYTRAEIIAYLEERDIDFVTDESNFSDEFTRNNIRQNIIPLLQKINLSLENTITRACGNLRLDEELLHGLAVSELEKAALDGGYSAEALRNQPPALKNRIISLILSQNNISPSHLRIGQIAEILGSGGKVNLAKNTFAVVDKNVLCVEIIHQNYRKN